MKLLPLAITVSITSCSGLFEADDPRLGMLDGYREKLCLADRAFIGTVRDVSLPDPADFPSVDVNYYSSVQFQVERNLRNIGSARWRVLWPAATYPDGSWAHKTGWNVAEVGERYLVIPTRPSEIAPWSTPYAAVPLDPNESLSAEAAWQQAFSEICESWVRPEFVNPSF